LRGEQEKRLLELPLLLITYARVQCSSYNFRFNSFLCVFCVSVKVKLTVPLLCACVHSAWKGRPRNDLCCVGPRGE